MYRQPDAPMYEYMVKDRNNAYDWLHRRTAERNKLMVCLVVSVLANICFALAWALGKCCV